MSHSWNDNYARGFVPWDTGLPDPMLIELVNSGSLPTGRALDVGCGTGTNAIWLAQHGYDALGVDLAPLAIEQAVAKLPAGVACRFATLDFLAAAPAGGPFDLVFDRGCFHTFDADSERDAFAARVASVLAPGGAWVSLIGSTEGPPRDMGPPRRTARDVLAAVEPHLELVSLRSAEFRDTPVPAMAWICVARRRAVPAQPASRRVPTP
jgi:SAM-dependent methyltransferase